jgi:NhaP-type Na+/H+ or K+/H+ antiporter
MISLSRHLTYNPESEFSYVSNGIISLPFLFIGVLILSNLGPDIIFLILLPPLLFESSSKIDWATFKRVAGQSLLLAFPGVLINMSLSAVFVYYAFGYGWSWFAS